MFGSLYLERVLTLSGEAIKFLLLISHSVDLKTSNIDKLQTVDVLKVHVSAHFLIFLLGSPGLLVLEVG